MDLLLLRISNKVRRIDLDPCSTSRPGVHDVREGGEGELDTKRSQPRNKCPQKARDSDHAVRQCDDRSTGNWETLETSPYGCCKLLPQAESVGM